MNYKYQYVLLVFMTLVIIQVNAQGLEDIGFDDTVSDESVPINFLIPLAIVAGAILGINRLK